LEIDIIGRLESVDRALMMSTIKRRKLRATNMLMHLEIVGRDNGGSGKRGTQVVHAIVHHYYLKATCFLKSDVVLCHVVA
jgi:hypothetical protein